MEELEIHTAAELLRQRLKTLEGDLASWSMGGMTWSSRGPKGGPGFGQDERILKEKIGLRCPPGLGIQTAKSLF